MPGQEGKIHYPETLYDLHNLVKAEGTYDFYSGRIHRNIDSEREFYHLPDEIIFLDRIEDLKKINRSETYIDCGSTLSFDALLSKAEHLLPPLYVKTLKEYYNPALLCCTTPAGIIYSGLLPTPLSLLSNVIEVSYEIRRLKTHRWRSVTAVNHWIYHNQIYKNDRYELQSGDVILRMRIPANNWGHIRLRKINLGEKALYLAMTVDIARNYISNFRLSFALEGGQLYRDREREAHVTGRTISSSGKEVRILAQATAEQIGNGSGRENCPGHIQMYQEFPLPKE
jgi:xanthine dehydrogenase iron-sulfur cluster and FAD-binding subunit A